MYNPIVPVGGGVLAGGVAATVLPQTGVTTTNAISVAVFVALVVWAATYAVINRAN